MPSYRQLLRQAQTDLAPHEARRLVESLPSLDGHSDVALATSDPEVSEADLELFAEWRQRANEGEPIQLITGWTNFCELRLRTSPGVFIPRFETEQLVHWLRGVQPRPKTVVDLGTGTGAIAAALAYSWPDAQIWAVERCPMALAVARANLAGTQVEVLEADFADPLPLGTLDLVVSNPPYLNPATPLPAKVINFDPHTALFAADQGFADIAQIASAATRLLRPGGLIAVEHGDEQGAGSRELLKAAGFVDCQTHQDLAGRDRFVSARFLEPECADVAG